jgi:hypothetical protein
VKALRQPKVSPFTDGRHRDGRSLGAVTVCEGILPTPWSLVYLARCAGDRCTGQKLSPGPFREQRPCAPPGWGRRFAHLDELADLRSDLTVMVGAIRIGEKSDPNPCA